MALPLVTVEDRIDIVCTADPSVTLRPGAKRLPYRWRSISDAIVLSVDKDATVATVRPLNSDEQFFVMPTGWGALGSAWAARAVDATKIGLVKLTGGGLDGRTPDELKRELARLPLPYREALGTWILNASLGLDGAAEDPEDAPPPPAPGQPDERPTSDTVPA